MSAEPPKEPNQKKEETFFEFMANNKWETLAYIVLIFGLFLFIFERFAGGLLVGAILGFCFSQRLRAGIANFKEDLSNEGIFHSFILVAAVIALFIASPGLFIGAFVGAVVKPYLGF